LEYLQELRTSLLKMSNGNAPFGFYSECYAWHQSVILPVIIGHKIGANVIGLGEVAFSVGLCVGKPFCQTRVI
jgi:hypothetical protein